MNTFWGRHVNIGSVATNPTNTDISTADTIHSMIGLARSSVHTSEVSRAVNACLETLPNNPTKRDLARSVFQFIKGHIRFVEDETILTNVLGSDPFVELLIAPYVLLSMPEPMGDCDDFSMLAASMLLALEIPVKFVTIAVDPDEPDKFSHVFVKAFLSDERRWVSFDASHGSLLGWEKKECFRYAEWLV